MNVLSQRLLGWAPSRVQDRESLFVRLTERLPNPDVADRIVGRACGVGLILFVVALAVWG